MGLPESRLGLPILLFETERDFEKWMTAAGAQGKGAWLKFAKKGSGCKTLSRQEAIDAALCCGWIDGQIGKYDASYWLVRFTPRSPRSKWSKINQVRAQELVDAGRVRESGLREIEQAKADGRWAAAYLSQRTITEPDDWLAALRENPQAASHFAQLDSANRYAILYRLAEAKKPETRNGRIVKFVDMLARGETIHPPRRKRARPSQQ